MLTRLTIRSFRNLGALDLEIPPDGVVIIGENGQGKTNLLEAIYYLMLFRSLRGAKDRELVRFGDAGFFVAGTSGRGDGRAASSHRVTAGYELATGRKKVSVDGGEAGTLMDAVGRIRAVPFAPGDAALVAGGPGARRRFLDVVLAVSRPGHLGALFAMRSALKQRNAALRRGRLDEARAFDEPLASASARVAATRRSWVADGAARFTELCALLGETEPCGMRYHTQQPASGDAEEWRRRLSEAAERDRRRAATTVGPHRDDLRLTLAGHELRWYGSAGQHRTAAIALRVLEAETLTAAHGSAPIGLYDDVFAELDAGRQARLLRLLREVLPGQAVVVAPRDAEVPAALFERPRWQIAGGRIAG